jgi:phosphate-selective porin OprO/OprP
VGLECSVMRRLSLLSFVLASAAANASAQQTPDAAAPVVEPAPLEPTPEVVVVPPAAPPVVVTPAEEKAAPRVGYKDGFFLAAPGSVKLKLGGYVQADSRWFLGDDDEVLTDQFLLRRVRLDLGGSLGERFELRFLPDFAGSVVGLQDAWGEIKFHDAVRLRFGKFKTPFGLERLQSGTALHFVERALPTSLGPNRDVGVQLGGDIGKGKVAWAVAVTNGVADGGSVDTDNGDEKEFAARVFVTPLAGSKSAARNVGVGVAATYGKKEGTVSATSAVTGVGRYVTPGQNAFFATRTAAGAAVGNLLGDGDHLRLTAQGYAYIGPFGLLAEVITSSLEVSYQADETTTPVTGTLSARAWQVTAVYELTGEDASYKGAAPEAPFGIDGGAGGFELAARVHGLTVDDEAFDKGFADPARSARGALAFGVGARWNIFRGARFYLDVEHTEFDGGAADGEDRPAEDVVLTRLQTVF